ncbi:MAG: nitrilase-related carbon-nitrogen hydrolase [Hyphomicrobiaceae bacterium]
MSNIPGAASLRHIAKEAGAWVIGAATALQGSDIPADFPERDRLFTPEEWINPGDAVVVKPNGSVAAGPLNREKGILYADIDAEPVAPAARSTSAATTLDQTFFRCPSAANRLTLWHSPIDLIVLVAAAATRQS